MKILREVKNIEVKRAFVVSDLMNTQKGKKRHLRFIPEKVFKKKLGSAHKLALQMKEPSLDKIIGGGYKRRLVAYEKSRWYLAEVKTSEVGVWTRAGGLPLSWTNGSLAETAKEVKYALDHNPKLLKKRSRTSIPNMINTNIHLLQKEKYLLPIIFKDGTGTNGRRRLKRRMKGDIDDGCMRAIALAVSGKKLLKVYFGFPRKTK